MSTAVSPVLAEIRVTRRPSVSGDARAWCAEAAAEIGWDEPVLAGHYPGFPIFPGVCVVECVHRAGLLTAPTDSGELVLAGMDSVRFLAPVFPGDELRMDLEWRWERSSWQLTARAATGRGEVAIVRLRYRSGDEW